MSEWMDYALEKFALINPKESLPKGTSAKKFPMDVLGEFKRSLGEPQVEDYKGGTKFRNGDTLIARITPCLQNGKTAFVDVLEKEEIAFGSTEYIVLREKAGISHDLFLYYLSISPVLRRVAMKSMTGSSGRQRVQNDVLKSYIFNLPPLAEQKAIAHILGKLDDKIELNRKMNHTLEAMAQALFKSWFVDFDPVIDNALAAGHPIPEALQAKAAQRQKLVSAQSSATGAAGEQGSPSPTAPRLIDTNPALSSLFPNAFTYNESLGKWIPEGWEVKKLCELVEIKYGKDHKKLEEGPIPCYGSGGIMRFVDKAIHEEASVLIPRKGTLNNIFYTSQPFWSVDTMFFTKMRCNHFIKYFFYSMKRLDFNEMNEGSAVPSMTTAQLNAMDILHPNPSILKHFDKILDDLFAGMEARSKETETLTQIRDTLLPQLISGKVRVPEKLLNNPLPAKN